MDTGDMAGVKVAAGEARVWLFDVLLPFWAELGLDPDGGFHDQLGEDALPRPVPKRCRVQSRQTYVFAEAGKMGWDGPWRNAMQHGLNALMEMFGGAAPLFASSLDENGRPVSACENYEQAFALFALAQVYVHDRDPALLDRALDLIRHLRDERRHPDGGFYEAGDRRHSVLCSNPHMHFFEAALAWVDATNHPEFVELAREIADLARSRMIEPRSGALLEYFSLDWSPQSGEAGRLVEPGHQFEWAWLFARWESYQPGAGVMVARQLFDFGQTHGIDPKRNVAFNEIYTDGSAKDRTARLWPQTERLKAAVAMVELFGSDYENECYLAWKGLQKFCLPANRALFRDKMREDGTFLDEASFASSLYHITCAVSELHRLDGAQQAQLACVA